MPRACSPGMETLIPAILILAGATLVILGVASAAGRALRLGRMPGDISARRGPVRFYAPLGTSLLVSVILTVVLNLALCGGPR